MSKDLEKAIKERDKYLEEHPELKPFQKKISEELDGLNFQDKMIKLFSEMSNNQLKLINISKDLINNHLK